MAVHLRLETADDTISHVRFNGKPLARVTHPEFGTALTPDQRRAQIAAIHDRARARQAMETEAMVEQHQDAALKQTVMRVLRRVSGFGGEAQPI